MSDNKTERILLYLSVLIRNWGFMYYGLRFIFIFPLVPPQIDRANLDLEPRVVINRTIQLNCAVSGIPTPDVKWLRNDEPLSALRYDNCLVKADVC